MKNDLIEASIKTLRERLQGHPLEAMLLVLVLGLRRDEVRRLTWSEVDLHTGEMAVCNSKTKSQVRRLRLPENVVHVLRQHALRQEEQNRDTATARPCLDLVFPDSTGGERSVQHFLQAWHALCEQVGLPRLRFHDLRVLVWRQLLAQERTVREGGDGSTNDLLNEKTKGEALHHDHM